MLKGRRKGKAEALTLGGTSMESCACRCKLSTDCGLGETGKEGDAHRTWRQGAE